METVTRFKLVVKTQGRFRFLPKRPETGKNGRKKVEDTFLYTNYRRPKRQENASRRFGEYRNSRLKLPKYRMKNWPIPQYRKPQCPPRKVGSLDTPAFPVVLWRGKKGYGWREKRGRDTRFQRWRQPGKTFRYI